MKIASSILAGLLLSISATGFAQQQKAEADYPTKPIRILVGFTPGGGPDITARYIAQKLAEAFDRLIRDEVAAFSRIASSANIKVD